MLVAITGGTGFVGRNVISHLIDSGHTIRAWYRRERPAEISGVEWVQGSLNDPDATATLVDGCDAVVHSAVTRQGQSFMNEPDDPIGYFETNVIGSLRLIEQARKSNVQRLVCISSGTVHQQVADDLPLDERHPLWPTTMYGAGKASLETLCHAYGLSGRLNIATLRPVSIVGVDDPVANSKWFDLVQKIKRGEQVDISGGGKVIPVTDLARAAELLLRTDKDIAGQTYNCTIGFYSNHRIATIAKEICGSDSEFCGEEKTSARQLHTEKIENLGMKFSDESEIRRIVTRLLNEPNE
ncbi:NAD-dependent epimerase/dehydratase family protein [Rhodopirellula sallentina]|uniref:NAD-dependent epimerase/dehydratase n=1 Tax=Rhodopirellula sallentina SM41 TaxID=1263870 RepID=M5U6T2_9BACT|nr:NAD(P)-dependent oxidoreductase [Rhodopirellula sallentina]EMI56984.1 NAD-dependent epimerase/dehydratase [Rhodopirellula sallentina SM41]